jgi:hypothetical protein
LAQLSNFTTPLLLIINHCKLHHLLYEKKAMMPQWNNGHKTALKELFASNAADPECNKNDYIDRLWREEAGEQGSILRELTKERFRAHYKEKLVMFMTDKSVKGQQHREMLSVLFFLCRIC